MPRPRIMSSNPDADIAWCQLYTPPYSHQSEIVKKLRLKKRRVNSLDYLFFTLKKSIICEIFLEIKKSLWS